MFATRRTTVTILGCARSLESRFGLIPRRASVSQVNGDIGNRVRVTREALGWSLERLAAAVRVDESRLSSFESDGSGSLSTAAVARMARALGVPLSTWLSPAMESPPPAIYFRQTSVPDFDAQDLPTITQALETAAAAQDLLRLLGREPLLHRFTAEAPRGDKPYVRAYQLARAVRNELGQYDGPIVDMRRLLEDRLGVPVIDARLRIPSIAAVTTKGRDGKIAAVVINSACPRSKWTACERVDLAHELAHVLFDASAHAYGLWIDLDADLTAEALDNLDRSVESRAKAFAAEFLAPERGLKRLLGEPQATTSTTVALDLAVRAMNEFGLSADVTANHLRNRGYIADEHREWVAQRLPRPSHPTVARSTLLERLVAEALARDIISGMRAREILGLTPWDDVPRDGEVRGVSA